jgi:hypothetical protein
MPRLCQGVGALLDGGGGLCHVAISPSSWALAFAGEFACQAVALCRPPVSASRMQLVSKSPSSGSEAGHLGLLQRFCDVPDLVIVVPTSPVHGGPSRGGGVPVHGAIAVVQQKGLAPQGRDR